MNKNQIKSDLRKVLLEKKGDSYDYGCVMLYFKISNNVWSSVQDMIPEDELYTEEGGVTFGRENDPHITILFGLHDTISDDTIKDLATNLEAPESITLKDISIFSNDKYDVVKFDVTGDSKDELSKMNDVFTKQPHTTNFPDYHPHCTIAYVKAGNGSKYVKTLSKDKEIKIKPNRVIYSKPDGTKKTYNLKK
tara:strand:- start:4116 stop:4694 length:579 start_codon:yes stop_codon:yes gene_type:complete